MKFYNLVGRTFETDFLVLHSPNSNYCTSIWEYFLLQLTVACSYRERHEYYTENEIATPELTDPMHDKELEQGNQWYFF